MKIVVDINHPAHVHYFKHFIWEMKKRGHDVVVTASEKDITFKLLENYNIEFINVGNYGITVFEKMLNLPLIDIKYYKIIKKIKPNILIGFGSIRAAHAAFFLRKPCINFEDTEHSIEQILLYMPFVNTVCTPSCYIGDLGKKQVRFNGYMELASLHPNRFTPDPTVLNELGLTEDDRFIIVRFVSWQASHDIGQHGVQDKIGFIEKLARYGRVLITSEGILPKELKKYQVQVSPEKIHNLLYYATLYVGEGATMASESAVLGTHAIYINTLSLGYISEEDDEYHLVSDFSRRDCSDETVLVEIEKLLNNGNIQFDNKDKRRKLLEDKIDVTAFMIWLVENYPQSVDLMKNDHEIQNMFTSQKFEV